jgi:hypothetical protein
MSSPALGRNDTHRRPPLAGCGWWRCVVALVVVRDAYVVGTALSGDDGRLSPGAGRGVPRTTESRVDRETPPGSAR